MIISVILNIAYLNCLNQQSYILKQVPEVIHSFSDITVANLAARTAKAFHQTFFTVFYNGRNRPVCICNWVNAADVLLNITECYQWVIKK